MEWVASNLTLPRNIVYPVLLPLMRIPRLPVVAELTPPPPADLKGLIRFAERRNLVSARVPSHFKRNLPVSLKRHGKSPLYPCSRSLSVIQSQFGRLGLKKKSLDPAGNGTKFIDPTVCSQTTILTFKTKYFKFHKAKPKMARA